MAQPSGPRQTGDVYHSTGWRILNCQFSIQSIPIIPFFPFSAFHSQANEDVNRSMANASSIVNCQFSIDNIVSSAFYDPQDCIYDLFY